MIKFKQAVFGGATCVHQLQHDKCVYIGSCIDAISDSYSLVINCARDLPQLCNDATYKHVELSDDLDSDLTILTSSFVDDLLSAVRESDGDVLFHCVVGSSRSVAVCCAVLARLLEQPWQRVYEKICDQRSCVSINKRFAADLDALA
jgi:predicted protein tyrosine phosphatase